nr:YARHG domain-containing protein [Bacteroidota bacterium]
GEKIDSHQISYHSDGGFDTPITDCMFSTDINDTIIEITEEWSEVIDYELFRLIQNSTEIMSYEIDLPKKNRKISKYLIIKPNGSFRIVKNGNFTSDSTLYGFTSKRLITKKELGELHPVQLRIIRNEIFARHGYVFESRDLIKYFWDKEWYKPVDENDIIMSKLNWFEKTNSQLIMEREIGH